MKKMILTFVCVVISWSGFSQTTYLADTAFTTDPGFSGAAASCMYTGGNVFGWNVQWGFDEWVADQFTIPTGSTWTFDTVIVYAYQWGSTLASTFTAGYLQVYDGIPGAGGNVIWGDTTANVLAATGFSGVYRVDTSASTGAIMGSNRPVMYLKLHLSPAPSLNAGSYWLSWTTSGTLPATPECPEKVLPGRVNPTGQVARSYHNGTWHYIEDHGNDVGLNMIIKAKAGISSVTAAQNTEGISLLQNVPNPFNSSTDISFYMEQAGPAKLSVYNTIGQVVAVLFDETTSAGRHDVTFNASKLPGGIYYYRLSTNSGLESRPMLITK